MARHAFGGDPLHSRLFREFCCFPSCREKVRDDLPLCTRHALHVYLTVKEDIGVRIEAEIADAAATRAPAREPEPVVYYLRVGPYTAKIGTTTNLAARLGQLRTDSTYVMAVEPGGRDVEANRHKQFAAERFGRREDFKLTERLRAHIETISATADSKRLLAELTQARGPKRRAVRG